MRELIRYDRAADEADPTLHVRLVEWVRSLGLNPDELLPEIVVLQGASEYELHASQILRREDGSLWIDEARRACVTKPLIFSLGLNKGWPLPRALADARIRTDA